MSIVPAIRRVATDFRGAFDTYWSWAASVIAGFTLINQVVAIKNLHLTVWLEKVLVLYHAAFQEIGRIVHLFTNLSLSPIQLQLITLYCMLAATSARTLFVLVRRRDNGQAGVSGSKYNWASWLLRTAESGFGSESRSWRYASIAIIAGGLWPLMVIGNVELIQINPAYRGAGENRTLLTSYRTVFIYQFIMAVMTAAAFLGFNAFAETRDEAASDADCTSYVVTAAGHLNVRAAPSNRARILRRLPTGSGLRGTGRDREWLEIWDPVSGYVSRSYVRGRCDETGDRIPASQG